MNLLNLNDKFRKDKEIYLRIKVRPMAAETKVKEILGDGTIKIDVAAVPAKGKANEELVKFLAGEFGVDKDKVKILSGHGERVKLVRVTNNT